MVALRMPAAVRFNLLALPGPVHGWAAWVTDPISLEMFS
jgi:hypothetical protein